MKILYLNPINKKFLQINSGLNNCFSHLFSGLASLAAFDVTPTKFRFVAKSVVGLGWLKHEGRGVNLGILRISSRSGCGSYTRAEGSTLVGHFPRHRLRRWPWRDNRHSVKCVYRTEKRGICPEYCSYSET